MTGRGQLGVVAIVLVAVAAIGFAVTRALGTELTPLGAGTRAPDFHAVTLDTPPKAKSLADYKGQVVLVNIWATWCQPCRVEMPSIERLYKTYGPKGLRVVAVSIDDPGTEPAIRAFVRDMGMTFDVLHDPAGKIEHAYQVTGYPETVIIGKDGVIRKKVAMAIDWDTEGNRRLIEHLLSE
ncbi:MAG TPA: TlpA disulfide reductase family protein [Gemmatimonadaceae bacterium]|nr:TlpA disulfide reductase family protein [Gemmatimonadaceae bacterium]